MADITNGEHPLRIPAPRVVKRKWPRWRRLLLITAAVLIVVVPASIVVGNKIQHPSTTQAVAFSPDGHLLASGSTDGTIKLWDVASGTLLHTLSGPTGLVTSVAFSPNGRILASGSVLFSGDSDSLNRHLGVYLWDVASGKELRTLPFIVDAFALTFSPDGRFLYVGTTAGVPIWDTQSGKELPGLEAGGSAAIAVSPDGHLLASTPGTYIVGDEVTRSILLWDVASRTLLRTLSGHAHAINALAFSPDGHLLASGSADRTIKLWDIATGTVWKTLTGHTDAVNSVAFSPDGHTLVSGSSDQTIKLWDVQSGTLLRTLTGHTSGVRSVVFSPDGRTLASGSSDLTLAFWADQTVKLWNVQGGSELRTFSS